jgi:hypothetical protein
MLCAYFDIPSAKPDVPSSSPTPKETKKKQRTSVKKKSTRVKPSEGFGTSKTLLAGFKKLPDEIDVPDPMRDTFTDLCEEIVDDDDDGFPMCRPDEEKIEDHPWVDGGDDDDDDAVEYYDDNTTEGDYPDGDDDDDIDDTVSLSCCSTSPGKKTVGKTKHLHYVGHELDFEEEDEEDEEEDGP